MSEQHAAAATFGVVAPSPERALVGDLSPLGAVAGTAQEWTARYSHALMGTFGIPQRILVRGHGAYVWDVDGKRYLDLLAGIAVNALGHAHPTLVSAVAAQLGTLGHISNFFASPTQIALAERLLGLAAPGGAPAGSRVFFTNSGTEANEAAFKMARRTGRPRILALEGSFHGRTMGALALTHKPAYRAPFEPLPGGVEFLPFGDLEALSAAMGDDVAAVFVEPVQGEAGVRPLPPGYLAAARALTRQHGALLVVDEVQTGMGRTGAWLAHHHPHIGGAVVPDVVTLAKGLGGGFPIGAVIGYGEPAATLLGAGQHGSTFGGNPVACAAALATIHVIERDGLLAHAWALGDRLKRDVTDLGHPLVAGVRGEGLLVAIVLDEPIAPAVAAAALAAGYIVNAVAPDAIRLAPPLVLTAAQVADLVTDLPAILDEAQHARTGVG